MPTATFSDKSRVHRAIPFVVRILALIRIAIVTSASSNARIPCLCSVVALSKYAECASYSYTNIVTIISLVLNADANSLTNPFILLSLANCYNQCLNQLKSFAHYRV